MKYTIEKSIKNIESCTSVVLGIKTVGDLYKWAYDSQKDAVEVSTILSNYGIESPLKPKEATLRIVNTIEKLGLTKSTANIRISVINEKYDIRIIFVWDKLVMKNPIKAISGIDCDYPDAIEVVLNQLVNCYKGVL